MKNILLAPIFAAVEGAANVPENFVEKILYGLQIAAIGICIVFAVLAIIMAVLYCFEYIFYTLPNKKKNKQVAPKPTAAPVAPVAPAAPVVAASSEDEDEIAAVIAAAVAAYYEQAAPASKYRIKSFRRI